MNDHHQDNGNRLAVIPYGPGSLLAGLTLFGIGFGFVEAVVVVDLRAILSPAYGQSDLLLRMSSSHGSGAIAWFVSIPLPRS